MQTWFLSPGQHVPELIVRLGRGDGTFNIGEPILVSAPSDYNPHKLALQNILLKDMNHDGHLDVVGTTRDPAGGVAIFYTNGE